MASDPPLAVPPGEGSAPADKPSHPKRKNGLYDPDRDAELYLEKLDSQDRLAKKFYELAKTSDFIMGELLVMMKQLDTGIENVNKMATEATEAKEKNEYMQTWLDLYKRKTETLREIIRLNESRWVGRKKPTKTNKTAPPTQMISVNNRMLCEPTQ